MGRSIRRHPKGRSVSRQFSKLSFEFFELKESSQGLRIPHPPHPLFPGPPKSVPNSIQIQSKIDQKIYQNVDVILVSFLAPLGSLLGPLGRPNWPKFSPRGPKIAPRRPKMASRPAKMTFLMPNRDFSKIAKILRKFNGFGSPSRPKITPRWP